MPWFWGPGMGCGMALMWLACRCGLCPLLLCFFCCCCFFAAKKEFMSMPEATNNKQRNSNKRTITESEYYNGIGGGVGGRSKSGVLTWPQNITLQFQLIGKAHTLAHTLIAGGYPPF